MRNIIWALPVLIGLCATAALGNGMPRPWPPASKPDTQATAIQRGQDNRLIVGGVALTCVVVGGGLFLARRKQP